MFKTDKSNSIPASLSIAGMHVK